MLYLFFLILVDYKYITLNLLNMFPPKTPMYQYLHSFSLNIDEAFANKLT